MALLKQQAKAEWVNLLAWCLCMVLGIFLYMYLWNSMNTNGSLAQMQKMITDLPAAYSSILGGGMSILTIEGWLMSVVFGGIMLVPFVIYMALFVAGMVTREMDKRTMEFLLGLPVSRTQVLFSRWGGMVIALFVLFVAHLVGTVAGVAAIGQKLDVGRYLIADMNGWVLIVAVGTLLLLVTIFIDDYGRGVGATLGVGLGIFFYNMATESATGFLKSLRSFLPTAFYNATPILQSGTVPWGDMAILVSITIVALGLSLYFFERKQIAV